MTKIVITKINLVFIFAWASITNTRLDGLDSRNLFLTVLEIVSARSTCQQDQVPVTALFLIISSLSLSKKRNNSHVSSSIYKSMSPIMGVPPSWPNLILITFQRLHLQIPSPWGVRISTYGFWRDTNFQSKLVLSSLFNHL